MDLCAQRSNGIAITALLEMFIAVQRAGMPGAMSEVRHPLSEVAPHHQRSDSLGPPSPAIAKPLEQRKGLEKPHRELSHALPKTGQAGQSGPSARRERCRPDLAEAQQSAPQQVCTRFSSSPSVAAIGRLMCIARTAIMLTAA